MFPSTTTKLFCGLLSMLYCRSWCPILELPPVGQCHSGCPPQKVSPGHYPLADIVLPDTIRNTDSVPPSGFCPTTRNTGISFSSRVLWSKYRNYGLIIDHQIEKLILLIALLNKISQILNATLFIKLYCVDGEDFCSFH